MRVGRVPERAGLPGTAKNFVIPYLWWGYDFCVSGVPVFTGTGVRVSRIFWQIGTPKRRKYQRVDSGIMPEIMPEFGAIMAEYTRISRKYAHKRVCARKTCILLTSCMTYSYMAQGRVCRAFCAFLGRDFFAGPARGQRAHTDYSVAHKSFFVK